MSHPAWGEQDQDHRDVRQRADRDADGEREDIADHGTHGDTPSTTRRPRRPGPTIAAITGRGGRNQAIW